MLLTIANYMDKISDTKIGKYLGSFMGDQYARRLKKYYFNISKDISVGMTDKLSILIGDSNLFVKDTMCLSFDYAKLVNFCFPMSRLSINNIYSDGQFIRKSDGL